MMWLLKVKDFYEIQLAIAIFILNICSQEYSRILQKESLYPYFTFVSCKPALQLHSAVLY